MAAMMVASGMLSAAPVKPAIGSTAVFKMMKINAATNLTAPAPTTGCTPKIATWGASNQCRGSVGAMADGAIVAVASSSGFSGSANFSCDAATNTLTLQPGSTCTSTAAAPSPCSSQAVNWSVGGNACSATAPSGSHASTVGVTDNLSPSTGSAQFACYSGTYAQVGSATCNLPASCIVTTGMGGVWGAGCQANYAANESVPHGSNRTLTDPGPFGYNGSATYVCNDGAMVYQSGSCANTPAPANCTSQSVSWSSGGTTCTGTAPATAHAGTTAPISAAAPNSGSASFTCSNGTLSLAGGSSCLPPPAPAPAPASCAAGTLSWSNNGNTCSSSVGTTSHNAVASLSDPAPGNSGSASYTCNNGNYVLTSSSCAAGPEIVKRGIQSGGLGACAIHNGAIKCWGLSNYGENFSPSSIEPATPFTLAGLETGVQTFTRGGPYTMCMIRNGGAFCWGRNHYGQLGNGNYTNASSPQQVVGLESGVTVISKKYGYSTCAVHNGAAKCWGYNNVGQLGNGTKTSSNTPIQVVGMTSGVTRIEVSTNVGCAIKDGAAYCWGSGAAVGDGSTAERLTPVLVTGMSSGVTDIAVADNMACAIQNGGLKCWGYNARGNLGDGTSTRRLVPTQVIGHESGVEKVDVTTATTCAIKNGALNCWGDNFSGLLGNGKIGGGTDVNPIPSPVIGMASGVTDLSVGTSLACAIQNGAAKCWGDNSKGGVGNGTKTGDQGTKIVTRPTQVIGLTSGVGY